MSSYGITGHRKSADRHKSD